MKALAYGGAIGTALAAPNSTVLIDTYMKHLDKKSASRTLRYMKYRKLVEVREKNGEFQFRLTRKGRDKFESIVIEELSIPKPARWDRKWRAVVFDIPASYSYKRKVLLHKLRVMDFYKLQDSVWIHPFECEKEVGVIVKHLGLGAYVSFMVVDSGNFTDHAIEHFKKIDLLI